MPTADASDPAGPPEPWPRPWPLLVRAGFALLVLLVGARLFFGIDLGDEPVYVAIPWRFLLGDRPFVDEVNPIQTAALVTKPLVAAWVGATGSLEGVFLFLRFAWLALTLAVAASAFAALRRPLGTEPALVAAACAVAFVPLSLPTLSYNTLASSFLAIGCFLGLAALLSGARRAPLAFDAAGLAHALAVVALPTYAAPAALFLAGALAVEPERRRARLLAYLVGGLVGVAPFVPELLALSPETIAAARAHTGGAESWPARLGRLGPELVARLPHPWIALALALGFPLAARRGLSRTAAVLLVLLLLACVQARANVNSSLHFTTVALMGGLALPFVWERAWARATFACAWLPGLAGALAAGWTSSNGIANAGFGALPATLAALAFSVAFVRRAFGADPAPRLLAAREAALAVVLLALCVLDLRHTYIEDRIERLTARVDAGPARGLFTTPAKQAWLDDLARSIAAAERPDGRLALTAPCAIAYLATRMRPAARSVWDVAEPEAALADWSRGGPDLVVVDFLPLPQRSDAVVERPGGALRRVLRAHWTPLQERPDWVVYGRAR